MYLKYIHVYKVLHLSHAKKYYPPIHGLVQTGRRRKAENRCADCSLVGKSEAVQAAEAMREQLLPYR
jgi:hypothetical protein